MRRLCFDTCFYLLHCSEIRCEEVHFDTVDDRPANASFPNAMPIVLESWAFRGWFSWKRAGGIEEYGRLVWSGCRDMGELGICVVEVDGDRGR